MFTIFCVSVCLMFNILFSLFSLFSYSASRLCFVTFVIHSYFYINFISHFFPYTLLYPRLVYFFHSQLWCLGYSALSLFSAFFLYIQSNLLVLNVHCGSPCINKYWIMNMFKNINVQIYCTKKSAFRLPMQTTLYREKYQPWVDTWRISLGSSDNPSQVLFITILWRNKTLFQLGDSTTRHTDITEDGNKRLQI